HIEHGAPPADAARIFTAELEIAIRQRNLTAEVRSATALSNVLHAFTLKDHEAKNAAEHALRVSAVTVHGEGRARGDNAMLRTAMDLYDSYFIAFDTTPAAYELHHHAGELLASLGDHARAERHYTAAVERDLEQISCKASTGKWLDSSASGAVTEAQAA